MSFVSDHLAGRPDLVRQVFELSGVAFNGSHRGAEWTITCPFHDDKHPSMDVNVEKARYICRACPAQGDAVHFYALHRKLADEEAIVELREKLGIARNGSTVTQNGSKAKKEKKRPKQAWQIRDAAGEVVAEHRYVGLDPATGKKKFEWWRNGKSGLGGLPLADLPLYGSEKLAKLPPGSTVILVEGEKACDVLAKVGIAAVATVTGAKGTPSPKVLSVLAGHPVTLWPDYDDPGREHMDRIDVLLPDVAKSIAWIRLGENEGDDAEEFFTPGKTPDDLIAAVEEYERENAGGPEWKKPPLLSRSLLEIQNDPPPPVRFAVEFLIVFNELALIFAKAFGGKSIFSLQLMLFASAVLRFLNTFSFPRPLRSLYVDEEMGEPLLHKRMEMMKAGFREFREPEVLSRVRVVSRKGLKFDDKKKLELLRRELGEFPGGPPDLTFFDTFRRLHDAEEKDSGEMARVMETAIRLGEEFKTAPVVLHHSKKGPQDDLSDWREAARGSSDLIAASQTVVALWKESELLFHVRADAKASGEIQPFPMTLDPATLLYRRPTEEELAAAENEAEKAKVAEAAERLLKSLRKMRDRGGGKGYPTTFNDWIANTTGKTAHLTQGRLKLQGEGKIQQASDKKWLLSDDDGGRE